MTPSLSEQILKKVIAYLNHQLRGGLGSIHQEPYRMDLFKLFAEAYNQGLITNGALVADRVRTSVMEQWFTHNEEKDKERLYYLDKVHEAWDEWQYAWQHADMKKR
jgi:hypothetical protein